MADTQEAAQPHAAKSGNLAFSVCTGMAVGAIIGYMISRGARSAAQEAASVVGKQLGISNVQAIAFPGAFAGDLGAVATLGIVGAGVGALGGGWGKED